MSRITRLLQPGHPPEGMLLLGPVGLVGGYFINGKSVHFHPGDKMTVTVDEDVMVHTR